MVDSRDPILVEGIDFVDKYCTNMSVKLYTCVAEKIETMVPESNIDELRITAFVGSYHVHKN